VEIEIRIGFCDPDGELVSVLDRPEWQRVTIRRRSEIVHEMVCVCERRGLSDVEAWRRGRAGSQHHVIGYWHPLKVGTTPGCGR
jgi:hypothetical protein